MRLLLWPTSEPAWNTPCTVSSGSLARSSSRDLAEMQGVLPSFTKKIFPKLEKAGIVETTGGIRGGYQMARPAEQISVLYVGDAVDGSKPMFDCQEIRARCALFDGNPPEWSTRGVCGIHAVMIRAENALRGKLAKTSLASLIEGLDKKIPHDVYPEQVSD